MTAIGSIGLVVIFAIEGYRAIGQNVGTIPTVRAPIGPYWVEPTPDEGVGDSSVGLGVYALAVGEEDSFRLEDVRLAPPPLEFTEEDWAMSSLRLEATLEAASPGQEPTDEAETEIVAVAVSDGPSAYYKRKAVQFQVVERSVQAVEPPFGARPPVSRPLALVQGFEVRMEVISNFAELEVDPTEVAGGTFVAQLDTFGDREVAIGEYGILMRRYFDLLGDRKWLVQFVDSGPGKYRLRVLGFDGLTATEDFCDRLRARGQTCIAAQHR